MNNTYIMNLNNTYNININENENINEKTILSNNNIVFKVAFSAFIGHGFLDFWPLCRNWDWTISLPYYLLITFSTIYIYLTYPLFVKLLFFVTSAYHFGSDWEEMSRALFLGVTMIGTAMGGSTNELKIMGFPDVSWLSIVSIACALVALLPFIKQPKLWVFPIIGLFGIYGVMFYAVCVHTFRSVYLLAKRYGKNMYVAWIGFTILCFALISLLEVNTNIHQYVSVIVGFVFGILFAHIICTYLWRNNEKTIDDMPEACAYRLH